MRFRILASLAIGVVLLGLLPWGFIKPPAGGVFIVLNGSINAGSLLICAGLAFIAGFLASATCTPYGCQIGIIAAPAGLATWGLKSAMLAKLFQMAPAAADRLKVYSSLKFEGLIWLALAVCGFLGAALADKIFRTKSLQLPDEMKPVFQLPLFAQAVAAIIGTVFVANFLINILGPDISYSDPKLVYVTAQPVVLQVAFAVFITFGACGFLAKLLLGSRPFWPAVATVFLIAYSIMLYGRNDIMTYLSAAWPADFFIRPVIAILPVQMVAFGCLGAVWGYWLAVDYHLWRVYES